MSTKPVESALAETGLRAARRGRGGRWPNTFVWLIALLMSTTLRVEVAAAQRLGLAANADILWRGQAFSPRRMQDDQVRAPSNALADLSSHEGASRTHWKRGALIGGVLSAALLYGFVFDDLRGEYRVVASVGVAAIIGWIPGALIGGQFPKNE